ncbi:Mbov_0399 family ICE element protein [Ureaplasma diversum]|uniref:Uncharacterized protein n=1 Tax=Ureaplasma diversum NCTC 246 TaxID=1188241 RepID=A0A084EZ37_9BACT|nr:hypothetical protein [Ureaplasma diversum]KEZ23229.1 hypothetical protein UDIV_3930 [Ureaplasma diversum NCTC 246]
MKKSRKQVYKKAILPLLLSGIVVASSTTAFLLPTYQKTNSLSIKSELNANYGLPFPEKWYSKQPITNVETKVLKDSFAINSGKFNLNNVKEWVGNDIFENKRVKLDNWTKETKKDYREDEIRTFDIPPTTSFDVLEYLMGTKKVVNKEHDEQILDNREFKDLSKWKSEFRELFNNFAKPNYKPKRILISFFGKGKHPAAQEFTIASAGGGTKAEYYRDWDLVYLFVEVIYEITTHSVRTVGKEKNRTDWNAWVDKLGQGNWRERWNRGETDLVIESYTGGDLWTEITEEDRAHAKKKNANIKSNWDIFTEYVDKWNKEMQATGNNLILKARRGIVGYTADLYLYNPEDNSSSPFASDFIVKTRVNEFYLTKEKEDRLKIHLGKWFNFDYLEDPKKKPNSSTSSTGTINPREPIPVLKPDDEVKYGLVDDKLTKDLTDTKTIETKTETIKYKDKDGAEKQKQVEKHYAGRWIAHTPVAVEFNTTSHENETLFVNNKKIQVLDFKFYENLTDNRTSLADNDRVLLHGYDPNAEENKTLDETNSTKKNEYVIQFKVYNKNKPGNFEEDLEFIYEIILVVDSRGNSQDYIWYAWNPEQNPDQKRLITEFLTNEDGTIKFDEEKKKVPNPLYDPSIDPKTGTKKQIVWFKINEDEYFDEANKPKTINDIPELADKWKRFNATNKLPPFARFIYTPQNTIIAEKNERGFGNQKGGMIAEAVVLGKGGLKQLLGNTEKYYRFKIEEARTSDNKLVWGIKKFHNGKSYVWYDELNPKTSDYSYFSESGIWLFVSHTDKGLSNFKLVLIKENTSPQTYFTDHIQSQEKINYRWRGRYTYKLDPFWETEHGFELKHYIRKKYKQVDINKLNYEDVLEYYKEFVIYQHKIYAANEDVYLTPQLHDFAGGRYTKEQLKAEFEAQEIDHSLPYQRNYYSPNEKFKEKHLTLNGVKDYNKYLMVYLAIDNDDLRVSLSFNAVNSKYKLSTESFKLPNYFNPKYKDAPVLNFNVNANAIKNLATTVKEEDFLSTLNNSIQDYIIADDRAKKHLEYEISYSNTTKQLTIKATFKPSDELKAAFVVPNDIKIIVDTFGDKTYSTHKEIIDSPRLPTNIFENLLLDNINLAGLTEQEEIKTHLTNTIKQKLESDLNLKLDEHYTIANLDQVVKERAYVYELKDKDPATKAPSSLLKLVAKDPYFGVHQISVYNNVYQQLLQEIDLSSVKLTELHVNKQKRSEVKQAIIDHLNSALALKKIHYGNDVNIVDFEHGLDVLSVKKDATFTFKVVGLNAKIKNHTTLKVINDYGQVENDTENSSLHNSNSIINLFDLSQINLDRFEYQEHILSKLRQQIYDDITSSIETKYNLKINIDYNIKLTELDSLVRLIATKNPNGIPSHLKLNSIINRTTNYKDVDVYNLNKDKDVVDDLDTVKLKEKNKPSTNGSNNSSSNQNSTNNNNKNIALIDLSTIKLNQLNYETNVLSKLRQSIYDDIAKNVSEKYQLNIEEHYTINSKELDKLVRKIGAINPDGIKDNLVLLPSPNISKNQALVAVFNKNNTNSVIDDLDKNPLKRKKINRDLTPAEKEQAEYEKKVKTFTAIFVPIGLLVLGGIGFLSWYIYVRKFKNKVK